MVDYKKIIESAIEKVVNEVGYEFNKSERACCHRLAYYLEISNHFEGYKIDCEYNRDGKDTKKNTQGNPVTPDIVIHRRGDSSDNLIVIEAKKNSSENKDKDKLRDYIKKLGYKYAFFIVFPTNNGGKFTLEEVT